jgi:hypothetical protein
MKIFHTICIIIICLFCVYTSLRALINVSKPEEYVYKIKEITRGEYYKIEYDSTYTMVYDGPKGSDFYLYAPIDDTMVYRIKDGIDPYLKMLVYSGKTIYQLYIPY